MTVALPASHLGVREGASLGTARTSMQLGVTPSPRHLLPLSSFAGLGQLVTRTGVFAPAAGGESSLILSPKTLEGRPRPGSCTEARLVSVAGMVALHR